MQRESAKLKELEQLKNFHQVQKSGTANKFSFPKTQEVMSNNEIT